MDVAHGRAVALRHELEPSGVLSLDSLSAVSVRLPERAVEHHVGDLPPVLPSGAAPRHAEPIDVVVRSVGTNGCWAMLSGLEQFDEYGAVLEHHLACLADALARAGEKERRREIAAFVASPGAVVPVHIDRHHNLLLQLAGHKTVLIGTYADTTSAQVEVERRYGRERMNPLRLPDHEVAYELGPGDGLYIPPFTFHRIEGGDDVSIALSCGIHTERSEAAVRVHRANGTLRRLGIRPAPPGRSPRADRVKASLVRVQDMVMRAIRR